MGMELYLHSMLGLCFVIGLIFLCAYLAKRYGLNGSVSGINSRLKVLASKTLDVKTKVVLMQKDDREYLILISGQSAQVIDRSGYKSDSQTPSKRHYNNRKREKND